VRFRNAEIGRKARVWRQRGFFTGLLGTGVSPSDVFASTEAYETDLSAGAVGSISIYLNGLAVFDFCGSTVQSKQNNKDWLLSKMTIIENQLANGNCNGPMGQLNNMLTKADGCLSGNPNDDKLCNCAAQTMLDALTNDLLNTLAAADALRPTPVAFPEARDPVSSSASRRRPRSSRRPLGWATGGRALARSSVTAAPYRATASPISAGARGDTRVARPGAKTSRNRAQVDMLLIGLAGYLSDAPKSSLYRVSALEKNGVVSYQE
jgi:hypothetical protein